MSRPYRPSRYAHRDKRWPSLRMAAKRRDGWQCVKCGSKHRLEVDHVQSVRTAPLRAFDLSNLQTMCGVCHNAKTRAELGQPPPNPDLRDWRRLLRKM